MNGGFDELDGLEAHTLTFFYHQCLLRAKNMRLAADLPNCLQPGTIVSETPTSVRMLNAENYSSKPFCATT